MFFRISTILFLLVSTSAISAADKADDADLAAATAMFTLDDPPPEDPEDPDEPHNGKCCKVHGGAMCVGAVLPFAGGGAPICIQRWNVTTGAPWGCVNGGVVCDNVLNNGPSPHDVCQVATANDHCVEKADGYCKRYTVKECSNFWIFGQGTWCKCRPSGNQATTGTRTYCDAASIPGNTECTAGG